MAISTCFLSLDLLFLCLILRPMWQVIHKSVAPSVFMYSSDVPAALFPQSSKSHNMNLHSMPIEFHIHNKPQYIYTTRPFHSIYIMAFLDLFLL